MLSRTHRITGGALPGKKRRLNPCLIPHAEYIVRSSYTTTHNLFNQICYFLLLETKGFEHVGYVTTSSNYTKAPILRLIKFTCSNLFSRNFNISCYLLAFCFALRSMLVSNVTVNSITKIVDSF